jgi:hypothetical protein
MPPQLAAASDPENKKGKVAKGVTTYGRFEGDITTDALRFRGMEGVYINPWFVNERNYFRNDADSAYRQKANKTNNDSVITDHENINTMYKGVQQGAEALSKYYDKPFYVRSKDEKYPDLRYEDRKKSLLVNVGDDSEGRELGNANLGINSFDNTLGTRIDTGMNQAEMSLNTTYADSNWAPSAAVWGKVFVHEFGHNLGADHPGFGVSNENSVMSGGVNKPLLLPADINYLRDNMGYTSTPQAIKQRVDRHERAVVALKNARDLNKKNNKKKK